MNVKTVSIVLGLAVVGVFLGVVLRGALDANNVTTAS
jgi:hypothetical protein